MVEEDIEYETFDGDVITKSDFRDEIIEMYRDASIEGMTKITDFTVGSEAYHLADVMATFILEHRELVDLNYRMSMIHTAEGEFLDNFGDLAGVHRKGSSASVGTVTFTRLSADTSAEILIADGTQVSTDDAISFIVDNDGEDIILPSGETEVSDVPVLCEQEGAYTNVEAHSITLVLGQLGNLVGVDNPAKFTEGEDIETDDEYRARILLSPYEVPTGTLAWYENVALTLESIHDVVVEKGETVLDADVNITYNPRDWTDPSSAEKDLQDLFTMKEYDIIGTTVDYTLAEKVTVLESDSTSTYLFAVILDTDYSLDMVKQDIIDKITSFNSNQNIGIEFSPSTLASIIENEIEGVSICRIVKEESGSYTEIVEPISVNIRELAQADQVDISNRIVKMAFNIDVEPTE